MMKNGKKLAAFALTAAMAVSSVCALTACGGTEPSDGGTDVTGTYGITYGNSEISGNIRHTGYITSGGSAYETNTLVLKSDKTYEYTKYVSSAPATAALTSAVEAQADEQVDPNLLFSFASAGDGNCALDCNKDGTYKFTFKTMNMTESGTWTWSGWTFKVKKPSGTEITATMNQETRALEVHYVADAGGGQLNHDFTCASSVWGAAFGGQGDYTPTESTDPGDATAAVMYYTGAGQKTGGGVSYDVTLHIFMLSNGKVYAVEKTETNATASVGSYTADGSTVTVKLGNETQTGEAGRAKLTFGGIETSFSTAIPDEYKNVDWDKLVQDAEKPAPTGPVKISYVFTGTYTNNGNIVTLAPATGCTWSEDWGSFQNHGFTNCSGTANDRVYPKGATGEWYLPLDHFGGQYYMAVNSATTVTTNTAVKVEVKSDGTMKYIVESAFD